MITLYTFGPNFGLPDASPFVMKAELLLKMSGIPYEINLKGFAKAPKGKLPYIEENGAIVADSTFIRYHLEEKHGVDFDKGLNPEQKGAAWGLEKMLEDQLYWVLIDERWMRDENFRKGPSVFFRAIPMPLRPVMVFMIRRKIAATLNGQGTGRHSAAEKARLAAHCLAAVSAVLGERPFLMGDEPCGADAAVLAFLAGCLTPYFDTHLLTSAQKHPNLVDYTRRGMRRYYPDFPWNG